MVVLSEELVELAGNPYLDYPAKRTVNYTLCSASIAVRLLKMFNTEIANWYSTDRSS
jgi:hypothetical protein